MLRSSSCVAELAEPCYFLIASLRLGSWALRGPELRVWFRVQGRGWDCVSVAIAEVSLDRTVQAAMFLTMFS
jgi:hypothetical protein